MLFLDNAAPRGDHRLTWDEALLFQPLIPAGLLIVLFGVALLALFDKRALPAVVGRP